MIPDYYAKTYILLQRPEVAKGLLAFWKAREGGDKTQSPPHKLRAILHNFIGNAKLIETYDSNPLVELAELFFKDHYSKARETAAVNFINDFERFLRKTYIEHNRPFSVSANPEDLNNSVIRSLLKQSPTFFAEYQNYIIVLQNSSATKDDRLQSKVALTVALYKEIAKLNPKLKETSIELLQEDYLKNLESLARDYIQDHPNTVPHDADFDAYLAKKLAKPINLEDFIRDKCVLDVMLKSAHIRKFPPKDSNYAKANGLLLEESVRSFCLARDPQATDDTINTWIRYAEKLSQQLGDYFIKNKHIMSTYNVIEILEQLIISNHSDVNEFIQSIDKDR